MSSAVEAADVRMERGAYRRYLEAMEVQIGCHQAVDVGLPVVYSLSKVEQVLRRGNREVQFIRVDGRLVVSQLLVYPAYAFLQVVLDDVQLPLIGAGSKLLEREELSQVVPAREVQPL